MKIKEQSLKLVLLPILLLTLSGCANLPIQVDLAEKTSIDDLNTEIVFLGKDNIPLPAEFFPQDIVLFFPPIPGQLFGYPLEDTLYVKRLSNKERKFILPLHAITDQVKAYASTFNQGHETEGLTLTPPLTKIVRIGTFAYDENTKETIGGGGGFTDRKSGDSLILVYVDQACKLFGTILADDEQYHHNIELPSAGLHWIRVEKTTPAHYAVYFYLPPEGVYYSVKITTFLET